jgi:hypothetical protein
MEPAIEFGIPLAPLFFVATIFLSVALLVLFVANRGKK